MVSVLLLVNVLDFESRNILLSGFCTEVEILVRSRIARAADTL